MKSFCPGSGLEPGGHFVHEGTTLLSHQQLRSRLAGEVGVDDGGDDGGDGDDDCGDCDDGYKEDGCDWIIWKPRPPTSGEISE